MTMEHRVEVQIPRLGNVTGKICGSRLECFLGIPYASVTKRWTRPGAVKPFQGGCHDGTHYGYTYSYTRAIGQDYVLSNLNLRPRCPQPHLPVSITQVAVPAHESNPSVGEDEFGCLNLNITRPRNLTGKVPVMVWIHGGAFSVGQNSEKVYDGIDLVFQSVKIGMPVIHVAVNYRLGFFGFSASDELLKETNSTSVGNYGLWDQRAALEFVYSKIDAFGGDPEKITIFGESAGAVSVHAHLLGGKPLFHRAICQSGVVNTLGPLPLDSVFHQGVWVELQRYLNAPDLDALRSLPSSDLVMALGLMYPSLAAFFLVDDSELSEGFFPLGTIWNSTPKFCEALMLGYCTNEGIIMAESLAAIAPKDLRENPKLSTIVPRDLRSIIDSSDMGKLIPAMIDFQTDLAFKGPIESVKANALPESLFSYRFERENHWSSSPFNGIAHHTIDLLYLAGIPFRYDTQEPSIDATIAEYIMTAWIKFDNGLQPWLPYGDKGLELVVSREGTFEMSKKALTLGPVTMQIREQLERDWRAVVHLNATLSNGAVRS